MKILIDNGHGVNTSGKCSPDKRLLEYKWAREIAQRIVTELRKLGYDAEQIVKEETDISINTRCKRVNAVCAKHGASNVVLVSVHINAGVEGDKRTFVAKDKYGTWKTSHGFSVFVSKNASSNSKRLAARFTDLARAANLLGDRSVPAQKFWTWSWSIYDTGILKGTACPAVLTENLFQDNKQDVEFLLSEKGKSDIVNLHIQAITDYIKTK